MSDVELRDTMNSPTKPKYHKIQSVFKRDPDNHNKTFLMWEWAMAEFGYLSELRWQATEKIDGTNVRIHVENDGYTIGGRTENAQLHVDLMDVLNDIGDRAVQSRMLDGLTLYGEGYGSGIQKNGGSYRPDKGVILYDVMVTGSGIFLERDNVNDIADKLGVAAVAIAGCYTLTGAVDDIFAEHCHIHSSERDSEAEGWVLRPEIELRTRTGKRIITKLKTKDFPAP